LKTHTFWSERSSKPLHLCGENELDGQLRALRRQLHRYPESAWTEFATTCQVISMLREMDIPVRYGREIHDEGYMHGLPGEQELERCLLRAREEGADEELLEAMRGGFTGCVAEIRGELPGPTIGIRVDMDCNDLSECTEEDHRPAVEGFSSCHRGCMHACGHDAHTAIGLGIASRLQRSRHQLRGSVILIFQPAEEGLRGAASMTAAGVVDRCEVFFSLHVGIADLPLGTVAAGAEGFLASTKFDVELEGLAAHAGLNPEMGKNAMAAAATAVLNLLAIPRHRGGASRINVGTLRAGTGRNVIPERAELTVETRGESTEVNRYMEARAKKVCQAAADMYECSCQMRYMGGAGSARCDGDLVLRAADILREVEGVEQVLERFDFGGGEDAVTMMERVQQRGGKATELVFPFALKAPHHNPRFDVDEDVMLLAVRCVTRLVLEL